MWTLLELFGHSYQYSVIATFSLKPLTGFDLIRPPVYGSNGRTYKMLVMFLSFFLSFFSPRVLGVPSTDRPETLPPDRNLRVFYNASPKIRGGVLPKKFVGQKHAKFRSILDHFRLWWRISTERLKISKIGRGTNYGNSSCVWRKKCCELWSTNGLELMGLDPLKCTYLGYHISAHRGWCAVKFLHALDIDQASIAHTRSGMGVPQKMLIVKI